MATRMIFQLSMPSNNAWLGGSITLSEKLYAEAENLCFLSGQHELVEAANLAASAARLEKKYRAQKQHRRQMARINQ